MYLSVCPRQGGIIMHVFGYLHGSHSCPNSNSPALQQAIKCPQLRCQSCVKIANEKGSIFVSFRLYSTFRFGRALKHIYDSAPMPPLQIQCLLRVQKHLQNLLCRCEPIKLVSMWTEVVWQRGVCLISVPVAHTPCAPVLRLPPSLCVWFHFNFLLICKLSPCPCGSRCGCGMVSVCVLLGLRLPCLTGWWSRGYGWRGEWRWPASIHPSIHLFICLRTAKTINIDMMPPDCLCHSIGFDLIRLDSMRFVSIRLDLILPPADVVVDFWLPYTLRWAGSFIHKAVAFLLPIVFITARVFQHISFTWFLSRSAIVIW